MTAASADRESGQRRREDNGGNKVPRLFVSWKGALVVAIVAAALAGAITFVRADDRERPAARTSSELAEERLPKTSEIQAEILRDGVVTREEYESVVRATIACLAERGFVVSGPHDTGGGWLGFTFATESTSVGSRYQLAYRECHETNQRDVDLVWASTLKETRPAPSGELVAASRAAIAECLIASGVDGVATDAPLLVMLDEVESAGKPSELFYRCAGEAYNEYGMVPDE